jgi:hypothetical protein
VIRMELKDVERTVHLDVASHDGVPVSPQGHSIGRSEGEALVVDTARFSEHTMGNTHRVPSGPGKHLIERFRLNSDGSSLTYRFELEDPEYFSTPVVGEVEWAYRQTSQ